MMEPEPKVAQVESNPKNELKKRWVILGAVFALLVWGAIDLHKPHTADLRQFNPHEVARLDNAMWRSYYARERLKLFLQLAELMRTQYHFPYLKSHVVAFKAARAAFVFKDGQNRQDYERALPYLIDFYRDIRKISRIPFNEIRTAQLELEWWIVHRERANYGRENLEQILAETSAELYQIPVDRMMDYAWMRAEAMTLRDTKALNGGVTEEDWNRIEELLRASWQSLWQAVNS